LNLVGLLLKTERPLTFDEIRQTLDAYGGDNLESSKRMFERDKDILRDYGVPLELRDRDVWGGDQGYLIPKDLYYLPEIDFTREELAALLVAAQSGGEETPAETAARKLLYGADGGVLAGLAGGPLASGTDARGALVLAAADAAQRRRRVRFDYRTAQGSAGARDVDAFAVVFGRGHWYLVGGDRERGEVRAFRLSRFTGELADAGEGAQPPPGFRAADHVERGPWAAVGEDRALVAFAPDAAWSAVGSFPGARVVLTRDDGWALAEIPVADEHELASLILGFGSDAEAVEPPSLREEIIGRLEVLRG
jgi:proteasome accessory factor B